MPTAHLGDRGVVRVMGDEARSFLDGLLTCALDRVTPGAPRFGGLLTPQGKLLFDFIVFAAPEDSGGGFYLDCMKVFAPDLARRLGFYKLRAKVAIEDLSPSLTVVAGWGDAPKPNDEAGLVAFDPRLHALGWRAIVAAEDALALSPTAADAATAYEAHRLAPRRAPRADAISCGTTLSARGPDGPVARRRFRQGLLCGPGGRVADAASRHGAHPNRAARVR
jgi:folate-binding Fe-S cluster repair protein YgfZ